MWWLTSAAVAGGVEVCNGLDDDGNGQVDDGVASIGAVAFPTVAGAVDAATGGEVITVCPGTHHEGSGLHVDVPLTLQGVAGETPRIDGWPRALVVEDGVWAVVTGLAFETTNAVAVDVRPGALLLGVDLDVASQDVGIQVGEDAHLVLSGSRVVATDGTAVVLEHGADADLGDSVVETSTVGVWMEAAADLQGGRLQKNRYGVYVDGPDCSSSPCSAGAFTLSDTVVSKNRIGIQADGADLRVRGVLAEGNTDFGLRFGPDLLGVIGGSTVLESTKVIGNGTGGIWGWGHLELVQSTVGANGTADGQWCGGGIQTHGDLVGDGLSRVEGNGAAYGGGLCLDGGSAVSGLIVSGNTARRGGAVYAGPAWERDGGFQVLDDVQLTHNVATEAGGGIWVGGTVTVTNATIQENAAPLGGGAYVPAPESNQADASLGAFCTHWGVGEADNDASDVATPVGVWSVVDDDLRCDFGGCVPTVSSCGLGGGGDTVRR